MEIIYDVLITGAGAAGLAAGIYSARARLNTLILNEGTVGGQMVLTNEIANYPGVETTKGYVIANIMKKQAGDFGCTIKSNVKISNYELEGVVKSIELVDGRKFKSKAVILAMGGKPRPLSIPGEDTFKGKGISYCSTCDGEFFTGKKIIVVGGGNSALEEAVTLTSFVKKVTIVHQFGHFQAFEHAVQEAKKNVKIDFIMQSELREFKGDRALEKVIIENLESGEQYEKKIDGVFIFVGYLPNADVLKDIVMLNEQNEIIVDADMKTNLPGVFAAGDCIAKKYRQVTTAVADGTIAALSAIEYLQNANHKAW
jgi:thioredoxin reductase (NADPH)